MKIKSLRKAACIAVVIFLSHIINAQDKGTNTIRVQGVSFNQVVNRLLDKGYSFEKIDSNYKTLRTEPREYSKKVGGMVSFDIRIKDSNAIISGSCGLRLQDFKDHNTTYYSHIVNRGMKGSLLRESFQVMNELALSLSNNVKYSVE